MLRNVKFLVVILAVLVIAGSAFAFADANTVPDTKLGDGFGVVSGYTVTAVEYTLKESDPSALESVKFDVGAVAETVQVQLVASSGTWYSCAVVDTSTVWTCDTADLASATIDQLRIVATSNNVTVEP